MSNADSLRSSPQQGFVIPVSSDVQKLRLLGSLIDVACTEGDEAREEALQRRYCEIAECILERPVRTWADVVEIAEIAHFWADKDRNGELLALAGDCGEDDRIAAELIVAVLTMARGGSHA